mgnify:CR=1 FL=1
MISYIIGSMLNKADTMNILSISCSLKKLFTIVLFLTFWQSFSQTPGCTALSLPANGSNDVKLDVEFEWVAAANASSYSMNVGTSSGGTDILDNTNVGNVDRYQLPSSLPSNTTIFVTIITQNSNGENNNCAEISFTTTAIDLPECTQLIEPIAGVVDVPLDTPIEWTASPGAVGYRITIGSASVTNDILDDLDVGNATNYQLPGGFATLTSVFLKITPYNEAGSNSACPEIRFTTTSGQVPQCTQIINPQDGTVLVPVNANITWIRNFTAIGYLMTIRAKDPDGAIILNEENVGNGTNYKPPNFEPRTKYFITLTPYNAQGNAVSCEAISITTGDPLPLPDCAKWVSPINGSTSAPLDVSFEWEAVANADGYILTIGTSLNDTDILNNEDVGNATNFDLPVDLPLGTTIYAQINTYKANELSEDCIIIAFTTKGVEVPDLADSIPKFFTPNNDGVNDSWAVNSLENIKVSRVMIFDRFGRFITQLSSNQQWDGTSNGRDLPSDSYWYAIELVDTSSITGFFALKR